MEILYLRQNKTGFLPRFIYVSSNEWIHRIDTNETHEEKAFLDYTRMLRVVLNKSWKQHSIKHYVYGYLLPIS